MKVTNSLSTPTPPRLPIGSASFLVVYDIYNTSAGGNCGQNNSPRKGDILPLCT